MREIAEAGSWLASAKLTLPDSSQGPERYTVVVAQCIHALIRANDALTVRYLGRRSTRHEDAPALFGELIRQHKIDVPLSRFRDLLTRAVSDKSEYDYKGAAVSLRDAKRWVRDAERFLAAVKVALEPNRARE